MVPPRSLLLRPSPGGLHDTAGRTRSDTSGTISGLALDSTGAAVPNASISVRNRDTNTARNATTEVDGRFIFRGLLVGRYELTATAAGFAKYARGPIHLALNQEAVVNAELTSASLKETVVVTEDAPMLNTSSSEVGVRFDEYRISELPISGQFVNGGGFRDVFTTALSAPGVSQLNSGKS